MTWQPSPASSSTGPELVVRLRLEEKGCAHIIAGSFEDERRLRLWLAHSGALERLREILDELLDEASA